MLNGLHRIVKWNFATKQKAFFISTVIFLSFGVASFIIGVWLYIDRNAFLNLTPTSYSALSAAGLCCFTGATVCIISVVGLAGAWMNNRCLIMTFIGFVILLGLIQSVTGIVGLFHKDEAKEHVRLDLLHNINRSHVMSSHGEPVELKITWNQLHQSLKCCGADGPSDWYYSHRWPVNQFVPDSCCDPQFFTDKKAMENCGKIPMENSHWFKQGCYPVFVDWLFHHIRVVNWLSIFLILVEICVLPPAILLWLELRILLSKRGKQRNEEEMRRRLVEINERERQELRLLPMDRVGDASKEPDATQPVLTDRQDSPPQYEGGPPQYSGDPPRYQGGSPRYPVGVDHQGSQPDCQGGYSNLEGPEALVVYEDVGPPLNLNVIEEHPDEPIISDPR